MRSRPVIPMIGRRVKVPWQLGAMAAAGGELGARSASCSSTTAPTCTPSPFAFRPERFLAVKPGTYTWIPFGGGIRRCLGATLAMAEQRVVLRAITRRTDMSAPDRAPEHARHRNVTMIPAGGATVILNARRPRSSA